MFEGIKLIMALVFTICFLAYSVLIGKFYDKFHISRTAWIVICVIFTAALAVVFIIDLFFTKHPTDVDYKDKD
jgi:drug/metabolite transporter (DMT)-like permease